MYLVRVGARWQNRLTRHRSLRFRPEGRSGLKSVAVFSTPRLSIHHQNLWPEKLQPGQRWISDTEPELGLGTVLDVDSNRGTLLFIATGERRIYALDNAPLTRVRFAFGDRVESMDGWSMRVESVEDCDGILAYVGRDANGKERRLEKIELNHFLRFNKPQERLFAGQVWLRRIGFGFASRPGSD